MKNCKTFLKFLMQKFPRFTGNLHLQKEELSTLGVCNFSPYIALESPRVPNIHHPHAPNCSVLVTSDIHILTQRAILSPHRTRHTGNSFLRDTFTSLASRTTHTHGLLLSSPALLVQSFVIVKIEKPRADES